MYMSGKLKICPRCKMEFRCNAENIAACDCRKLLLSDETKSYIANAFFDCMCNGCLMQMNEMTSRQKEYPFPGRGGELIEGVHYYNEGDYRVFNEFYLLSRGYCCRSGCRHCPYGFQKRYAE